MEISDSVNIYKKRGRPKKVITSLIEKKKRGRPKKVIASLTVEKKCVSPTNIGENAQLALHKGRVRSDSVPIPIVPKPNRQNGGTVSRELRSGFRNNIGMKDQNIEPASRKLRSGFRNLEPKKPNGETAARKMRSCVSKMEKVRGKSGKSVHRLANVRKPKVQNIHKSRGNASHKMRSSLTNFPEPTAPNGNEYGGLVLLKKRVCPPKIHKPKAECVSKKDIILVPTIRETGQNVHEDEVSHEVEGQNVHEDEMSREAEGHEGESVVQVKARNNRKCGQNKLLKKGGRRPKIDKQNSRNVRKYNRRQLPKNGVRLLEFRETENVSGNKECVLPKRRIGPVKNHKPKAKRIREAKTEYIPKNDEPVLPKRRGRPPKHHIVKSQNDQENYKTSVSTKCSSLPTSQEFNTRNTFAVPKKRGRSPNMQETNTQNVHDCNQSVAKKCRLSKSSQNFNESASALCMDLMPKKLGRPRKINTTNVENTSKDRKPALLKKQIRQPKIQNISGSDASSKEGTCPPKIHDTEPQNARENRKPLLTKKPSRPRKIKEASTKNSEILLPKKLGRPRKIPEGKTKNARKNRKPAQISKPTAQSVKSGRSVIPKNPVQPKKMFKVDAAIDDTKNSHFVRIANGNVNGGGIGKKHDRTLKLKSHKDVKNCEKQTARNVRCKMPYTVDFNEHVTPRLTRANINSLKQRVTRSTPANIKRLEKSVISPSVSRKRLSQRMESQSTSANIKRLRKRVISPLVSRKRLSKRKSSLSTADNIKRLNEGLMDSSLSARISECETAIDEHVEIEDISNSISVPECQTCIDKDGKIRDISQTFEDEMYVEEIPKQWELQRVEASQPANYEFEISTLTKQSDTGIYELEITHKSNSGNTLTAEDVPVPLTKVIMCAFCNVVFSPANVSTVQSHILGHFRSITNAIYWITYWDMRRIMKNEDFINKNSECYSVRSIYQCEFCPMTFIRKSNTIAHAIQHHQYSKIQNQKDYSFGFPGAEITYVICNVCYMHFTSLDILKTHRIMEKHYFLLLDENKKCTLGCLFCKKYFTQYSNFIEHTINEHAQKMNCIGNLNVFVTSTSSVDNSQTDMSLVDETIDNNKTQTGLKLPADKSQMKVQSISLLDESLDHNKMQTNLELPTNKSEINAKITSLVDESLGEENHNKKQTGPKLPADESQIKSETVSSSDESLDHNTMQTGPILPPDKSQIKGQSISSFDKLFDRNNTQTGSKFLADKSQMKAQTVSIFDEIFGKESNCQYKLG
ncbi:uncharacterized protein LOC119676712 [Teleopsis dalmanni]|uniref:uncharacterized protein LOC119676712 n=1 Tax=Teleopsis dalmanni TaxID=139649 RepID=UPI0018CF9CEA|nr:uncharacterized protein LOC119676712 [Teleopsis dalmanni]